MKNKRKDLREKKIKKAKAIASRCSIAGIDPPEWVKVWMER